MLLPLPRGKKQFGSRYVFKTKYDESGAIGRYKASHRRVLQHNQHDSRHYKAPVTPGLRPDYDLPATEMCWNRGQIVERTYDWSQRAWVIARAKSVAARSWSCSKLLKPQSHRAYDQVTTYLRLKHVGIEGKS